MIELNLEKVKNLDSYDGYDELILEDSYEIVITKESEPTFNGSRSFVEVKIKEKDEEDNVINTLSAKLYDDFQELHVGAESEMGHPFFVTREEKKILVRMQYMEYSILFEKSLGKTIFTNILFMSRERVYRKMFAF